jgi:hypothetical protein
MASQYLKEVPLPPQLPAILEKLLKAVLRDQPKDIIRYCADYFSALENHQLYASHPTDPSLRKQVESSYERYFKERPSRIQKEEVVKFMRVFGSEGERSEPMPNSIEEVLHLLRGRT